MLIQNLFDKAQTPIYRDLTELPDIMWRKVERDLACVGVDAKYCTYTPELAAMKNLPSTGTDPETDLYFYHGDHLGSSSFITDASAYPTQHLQYLPFGEDYIHQQNSSNYYSPFTFSAKERDVETELSYFGARYYEAGLSIWLSVDPLSDERPSLSAYNYCQWNPVMRIDPTGMLDEDAEGAGKGHELNKNQTPADKGSSIVIAGDPSSKGDKTPSKPGGQSPSGTNSEKSADLLNAGLICLSVPEGTVTKGAAVVLIAAAGTLILVENLEDFPNPFPGPWTTDRPKNYIPQAPNGINNENYFPPGNGGNRMVEAIIRVGAAAALGRELGEGMRGRQEQFHSTDNTYVSQRPRPMIKPTQP